MRADVNDPPDSSTRQRLIDATLEIITERGVEAVRVNEVADKASTTTGSLYWFFKSRKGLVNAALAELFASQMRPVVEMVRWSMSQSDVTIDMLFDQRFDITTPERVLARRQRIDVLSAALSDPDLAVEVAGAQRELLDVVVEVIKDAQRRGLTRDDVDPYAFALFIQSMTIGFAVADLSPDMLPDQEEWWKMNRLIVEILAKRD